MKTYLFIILLVIVHVLKISALKTKKDLIWQEAKTFYQRSIIIHIVKMKKVMDKGRRNKLS
jgi:hypothetical protein